MDEPNPLGVFLKARRELAQPADFYIPSAARRRVRGLRREEVAMLAGVSTDYYSRLEQGRDRHPSPEVLEALGRVFELSDEALSHLRNLATPTRPRRRPTPKLERIDPSLLQLLRFWGDTPAIVQTRFRDVLACTALAAACHPGLQREPNMLRLLFLDPIARDMYPDWERVARASVAWLRASAAGDLEHPRLAELVGELSVQSPEFARLWSRHDLRTKSRGTRRVHHPVVGDISLSYETLTVNATPGQFLSILPRQARNRRRRRPRPPGQPRRHSRPRARPRP